MNRPQIALRVDSSETMGTGHIMRCITLAAALREKGADCHFISRKFSGSVGNLIKDAGFSLDWLETPLVTSSAENSSAYSNWLGVSQDEDQEECRRLLKDRKFDWLILDHYGIDHQWESPFAEQGQRLFVIDDLANRKHNCRAILDQNYFSNLKERYDTFVPKNCTRMLGPEFSLLRPEFLNCRRERANSAAKKVLIFYGGIDLSNETEKALRALTSMKHPFEISVLLGQNNRHLDLIQKNWGNWNSQDKPTKVVLHIQVPNMSEFMLNHEVALGAGGTTTWERFCLGIPSIVTSVAENQEPIARSLGDDGFHCYLGTAENVGENQIQSAIERFISDNSTLVNYSRNSMQLVDGKGAERIVHYLLEDRVPS